MQVQRLKKFELLALLLLVSDTTLTLEVRLHALRVIRGFFFLGRLLFLLCTMCLLCC